MSHRNTHHLRQVSYECRRITTLLRSPRRGEIVQRYQVRESLTEAPGDSGLQVFRGLLASLYRGSR